MALGTQVPFTSPGGAPCCCSFCSNTEISESYQFVGTPTSFESATITKETFDAIKLYGLSIVYQFNVSVGSLQPGPIDVLLETDPITICRTLIAPVKTGTSPGTLLLWKKSNTALFSVFISCAFYFFVQDGGTGWPGSPSDPPPTTANPIVFVSSSLLGESVIFEITANSTSGINGYRAAFGNKYGSSGAATTSLKLFGQNKTITTQNSIASVLNIEIDVAAP